MLFRSVILCKIEVFALVCSEISTTDNYHINSFFNYRQIYELILCVPNRYTFFLFHRLFKVGDDVFGILDAHGQADQIRRYACGEKLLVGELAVSVTCWV